MCTLCSDSDYTPSTFTNEFGEKYTFCTTELCVDCPVSCPTNCAVCSNTAGTQCQACDSGYYLDSTFACNAISGSHTLTYEVQSTEGILFTAATINSADGSSGTPFYFLQQVFHKVYSDNTLLQYKDVTITVTLEDNGTFFLFSCHNDLYASYSATIDVAVFTDLCNEVTGLQQIYPPADNFNFVFEAASKATVYVNDPYFNFNVTGSMTFKNVEFRGEQALADYADPAAAKTTPPLATIPVKKCDLTQV